MAKVGAKLGLTIKLFRDSQYEFFRPELSIDEIDPDKNVKEQLKTCIEALKETWEEVTNQMSDQVIAKMPQTNKELELQISKRLQSFEKRIDDIEKLVAKVK